MWALSDKLVEGEGYRPQIETLMHQTIKKVGADIETLKMNTAIAQLMTLVNALYDNGGATKAELETVVQLLNPFAPHMTEELWRSWATATTSSWLTTLAQVRGGQVRGEHGGDRRAGERQGEGPPEGGCRHRRRCCHRRGQGRPAVAAALEGKQLVKEIYVKGRLVNLAVKG